MSFRSSSLSVGLYLRNARNGWEF